MKELKKHTSIDEQIALLKKRGLIIPDEQQAKTILSNTNYYRLTGYLHHYKEPGSDSYVEGLSLDWLKRIYDFDRKMTRILMYALEDIEETLKTRFSYTITSQHPDDPLIYLRPNIYREYDPYLRFWSLFDKAVWNNRELPFVKHHFATYNGALPMWVAVELLTMGNLYALYDNFIPKYQKRIAKQYGTGPVQLSSWIENLTYTRNHLAHYMRIYDFNFGRSPAKCKNHPGPQKTNMIFDQIFVISCMYSDASEWNNYVVPEIKRIITEYQDDILPSSLGFPEDWDAVLTREDSNPSIKK